MIVVRSFDVPVYDTRLILFYCSSTHLIISYPSIRLLVSCYSTVCLLLVHPSSARLLPLYCLSPRLLLVHSFTPLPPVYYYPATHLLLSRYSSTTHLRFTRLLIYSPTRAVPSMAWRIRDRLGSAATSGACA